MEQENDEVHAQGIQKKCREIKGKMEGRNRVGTGWEKMTQNRAV